MNLVAIYRHHLFKRSESFIHTQALKVPRHDKLFVGRDCVGDVPAGAQTVLLSHTRVRSKLRRIHQVITRDPVPFCKLLHGTNTRLIHAHFGVDGVYAQKVAERLDIPLVTTFHGFDATLHTRALLASGKPSLINYVLHRKQLAERGTRFLCVSEFIRDRVLKLGFPAVHTEVHYIGVDTDAIKPSLRRTEVPTVLHVARLVEKKGTSDLISAFAIVLRKIPDAKLLIVGDGPLKSALQAQSNSLGSSLSTSFLGALPNKAVLELMGRSWIFCLPSVTARSADSEGLPIVVLEAGASGLPVVATWHGGIPEAVAHEDTGLLTAERDVDGLASNIVDLLSDAGLRTKMSANSRARIVKQFDLSKQSRVLADIYESVC